MDKRLSVLLTFIALVLIISVLYFSTNIFSKITGYFAGESDLEKLTNCLDSKNSELFLGSVSKESEEQSDLLGPAIKKLKTIECDTSNSGTITDPKCKNLRSVPAWYINKQIHYGFKNISELKDLSGCQ